MSDGCIIFVQPESIQENDPLYGLIFDSSTCENHPIDDVSCTTQDGLDIIESTLSSEQKLKFQAALISYTSTKLVVSNLGALHTICS